MGTIGVRIRTGLYLLLLGSLMLPSSVRSHATGTALVDIYLSDDSLRLVADVNSDDILNAAKLYQDFYTLADSAYPAFHERIAYYLKTNLWVFLDSDRLGPLDVSSWYPGGGPDELMDSIRLLDTTYIVEFKMPFNPKDARLSVQSSLWARLGIEPITQVSFHYRDTLVHRQWIRLDEKAAMDVHPDTLSAILARNRMAGSGGGPPTGEIISRFIYLGFVHIMPEGLDHILFVLGLFFYSTAMRPLLLQVTAFTIAHSITLALAVFGIFTLPGVVVEPLIALSIFVVGIENIFFRRTRNWRWILVFVFGLIHGMGFAGVLIDLGLSQGNFIATLVGFNIGVELGQVAVIALAAVATFWFWKSPHYFRFMVVPASALISLMGLLWAVQRVFE